MAKFSVSYVYELVDKYSRNARKVKESTDRMRKSFDRGAKSVAKLGKKMRNIGAGLSAAITLPILLMGNSMIKAASDAEETRSKYNTVFKTIGSDATKVADTFAKSFGLAGSTARQLLGDTGDMLSGFGFTSEAALKLSKRTNELAVDLASFTNFSGGAEGASNALTKALLGERESVKSLGIAILDVDVKKKVAEMRSEGVRFATEREAKAYATLEIAISQSKNAIGDYGRTKLQFANTQRRVIQRNKELKESFGSVLLPSATKFLSKIEDMQEKLIGLDSDTKKATIAFFAFAAAAGVVLVSLGLIAMSLPVVAAGLALLFSPVALVVVAVSALIIAFGVLVSKAGGVWKALAAGALGLVDLLADGFIYLGSVMLDALASPLKLIMRIIDLIPGIKIPNNFKDKRYFEKGLSDAGDKKSEYLSEKLAKMYTNPAAEGAAATKGQDGVSGEVVVRAAPGAEITESTGNGLGLGTTLAATGK